MSPSPEQVSRALGDARTVTVVTAQDIDAPVLPGRQVRVQEHPGDLVGLHDALSAHGHADAVLDLVRGRAAATRLPVLLAHVRRGGTVVVALPHRPEARRPLLDLLDGVRRLRAGALDPPSRRVDPRPAEERDAHALAAACESVEVGDDLVVVRCGVPTWSVVPEPRVDDLLAAAPGLGEVVGRLPAASRAATAPFRWSRPDGVAEESVTGHDAPALTLRSWTDVVVGPRMVATTRDLVLPQAFRNTVRRRPRTPALADWSRWSVRVPAELDPDGPGGGPPPEHLPGTWFHADNVLRGHFGHALTEQLSQLWAWPEVLARHPDAGLLVSTAERPLGAWELELLEAAGVPRDRVHGAPGPVRVDRLLAATPGYVIPRHVHPGLRATYAAVGAALEARSGLDTTPRRVFVTRPGSKRHCHEAAAVEELFAAHGFTVVAPEEHPLADQVAMVRRAEAVAGWAGSGMFHLLLGGAPRPVLVVSHTGYHAWNEKAIAALWDHPLTVVRGTPDVVPGAEGSPRDAMHADFHLDLDREGRLLAEALAGL